MNLVVCPHCKSPRIVAAKVHRDVVVINTCPSCAELVVMFRKKVIPLNRRVLEHGSMKDRKEHLAEVIAEFLEPGMFSPMADDGIGFETEQPRRRRRSQAGSTDSPGLLPPITDREIDDFTRIHLQRLDDAEYFKRNLGK